MQANTSTIMMPPLQGDYAVGVRTQPVNLGVRGTFATGMTGSSVPAVHAGDFARGTRSRLHTHRNAVPADFARGLRLGESRAAA